MMAKLMKEEKSTELAVIDYGDDTGAGLEDMQREEFKIPILRILQSNSPQCVDPTQGGIDGAKPGMIFNTATGEMWPGVPGVGFIPVYRDHNFVAYIPRDIGGGFAGLYEVKDPLIARLQAEQGKYGKLLHEGTEIAETYYLFGLLMPDEDTTIQGVVPFTSTQISKYQSMMTRYQSITYPNAAGAKVRPPLWAHKWVLGTIPQKNKKGSFFGWSLRLQEEPPIKSRMRLDDPLYQMGRGFYDLLVAGKAQAAHQADAKAGTEKDDEIPF